MLLKRIASDIQLPMEFVRSVSVSASHRYKTYTIKKRTTGYRVIDHPARELKLLQHWLVDNLFAELPVHDAVYSYRTGRNIRGNAILHRNNNYLLRIDFSDFFPSIHEADITKMLRKYHAFLPLQLSRRDISLVTSIVCKNGCLTIGAPSSPIISNTILYDLDERLTEICRNCSVRYSRYADDLYFSTNRPNVLEKVFDDIKKEVTAMKSPRLHINHNKTVFTSRKRLRKVAGITLSSNNQLSIGRQRKRAIKSMVHKYINGELSYDMASYLRGFLAYIQSIEPMFLNALERKYGMETISEIRGIKPSQRK